MDWIVIALIVTIVGGFLFVRRTTLVREESAVEWLRKGAKVIDVRTESEYSQKHVAGAINIPLDRLKDWIKREVPDKDQTLLLHCAAGGRSAIGCRIVKELGYSRAHNLGSFGRAERIAKAAAAPQASAGQ